MLGCYRLLSCYLTKFSGLTQLAHHRPESVNEGTETFTILQGAATIGAAVTVNVVSGAAAANYTLPAATAANE